jgi:PAS domain S-box-containing protein
LDAGERAAYQLEKRYVRKDGGLMWGRLTVSLAEGTAEATPYAIALIEDITQRKVAEAALLESEERFRSLFEQSPFAIQTFAADGQALHANAAFYRLWGFSRDQIRHLNVLRDERFTAAALTPYIKQGFRGIPTEVPPMCYTPQQMPTIAGGQPHWLRIFIYPIKDAGGTVQEVMVIFDDITEQITAEGQLRETEAQYRSIFEATSDGLIINDLETGVVVEANPATCAMHGYARDEFIGRHPTAFIHPNYHALFQEYIETVKTGGQFHAEAVELRQDGTPFLVEVNGRSFTYRGKPHGLGVMRDITERVQAYQMLEQRVDERTRELSTLLDVSHNVASMLHIEPLLSTILQQLRSVVDYSAAAVFTLENAHELHLLEYQGPLPQERLSFRWPLDQAHHSRAVIEEQQPIIIADVWDDTPLAHAFRATAVNQLGTVPGYIGSWMGVPLVLRDQVIGVLAFDHGAPNAFGPRQAALALAFANHAAVAIENARLYERAQSAAALEERQRLARELHDSVSQALYGIALGSRTARTLLDRDPHVLPSRWIMCCHWPRPDSPRCGR